jgi:YgiT-type zinc finger domain-containing protein
LIHNCASCSLGDIWFKEDGFDVYLNLNRIATGKDVENDHYFECEGQIIEIVKVQVVFCPYCGEKLAGDKEIVELQFQHHNFGGRK